MRAVLSRKGFDSGSGGVPSPVLAGCPLSLPIPCPLASPTRFGDIEMAGAAGPVALGPLVEHLTGGRVTAGMPAHRDPWFFGADPFSCGPVAFGQHGAAQTHLDNQGVGPGDVLLFFGLFQDREAPSDRPDADTHHRIFGWMRVERLVRLGPTPEPGQAAALGVPPAHPHLAGRGMKANNALWLGQGRRVRRADAAQRLTRPFAKATRWRVPEWAARFGLSYHHDPGRWDGSDLTAAAQGQEFVCHLGETAGFEDWLAALGREAG